MAQRAGRSTVSLSHCCLAAPLHTGPRARTSCCGCPFRPSSKILVKNMWKRKSKATSTSKSDGFFLGTSKGLLKIYKDDLLPLEEKYFFHKLCEPKLDDGDFEAKPSVLVFGPYSTGKTSFIRYILNDAYPGDIVGPQPTTEHFTVITHGDQERIIPGHVVVVDPSKQFTSLSKFGSAFLQRFRVSQKDCSVLRSLTIIDSPGILSGEAQRTQRGYDFSAVIRWFAARVDRIVVLFDAHKLDISDDLQKSIEVLRGHEDKIRIVLNKADTVNHQQLLRVYGALMWNLGQILMTPEVPEIRIGSFWDKPLNNIDERQFFEDEEHKLFVDLRSLPRVVAQQRLNDLIKRARQAKVNAYIVSALKEKYHGRLLNRDLRKTKLLKCLPVLIASIEENENISPGDFPDIDKIRDNLEALNWDQFHSLDKKLIKKLDLTLTTHIVHLMDQMNQQQQTADQLKLVTGGHLVDSIFNHGRGEGVDMGSLQDEWVVPKQVYLKDFRRLAGSNGLVNGARAKEFMIQSKLPNSTLAKIWRLADIDEDGMLDEDEFCLVMHLLKVKLDGHVIPSEIPDHLIPPSKRGFVTTKKLA